MLLIQRLSAFDCQGARLSPPGLGVHYAALLPAHLGTPGTRQQWNPRRGAVTPTPSLCGGDPGQGTQGHMGDGCIGYLSLTYAVTSGLVSHRLSPSGRLASRRHLLPCSEVSFSPGHCPMSLSLGLWAARDAAGCTSGPFWSLGTRGLRARTKHPWDGVARGEQKGPSAPMG